MSDWIDFLVYAAFMVAFWFVLPSVNARLAIPLLADRNRDWLAAHPQVVKKIRDSRWFAWVSYALGAASVALLLSFQLGLWPQTLSPSDPRVENWMVLWNIHVALMCVGLVFFSGAAIIGGVWLSRVVPFAERRHATLERRSIGDFVPLPLRVTTYTFAIVNAAAWLAVGALGLYSTPIFWTRFAILISLSVVFFLVTNVNVNRRPNAMDRMFGPAYRRGEVRYVFAMQLLPPVIGAVRLYEEIANAIVFDVNRAMQLGLALFVTFGLLRAARYAMAWQDPNRTPPSAARSADVST
jgi:hypothetical protein